MTTSIFTKNTTTLGLETTSALGVTASTLNDDGTVNKKKSTIATSITTLPTSTAFGNAKLNDYELQKIYYKYSTAYINSLSDEELAAALEHLDLIEKEFTEKTCSKSAKV